MGDKENMKKINDIFSAGWTAKLVQSDALWRQYEQERVDAGIRGDKQAAEIAKAKLDALVKTREIYER